MKRPLLLLLLCLAGGFLAGGAAPAGGTTIGCVPTATRLCLGGNRFSVEATWTVPSLGSGAGQAVPLTGDTGVFWFFSSSNLELTVKVLDGRAVNRHFWIFFGGLSDVVYTLRVTDLQTGLQETYQNPAGRFASVADVAAFQAEVPPALPAPLPAASAVRHAAGAAAIPTGGAPVPVGGEIAALASPSGGQSLPALAVAPDGGFLVSWMEGSAAAGGVRGRFYDPAGNPRGAVVPLSAAGEPARNPRAAADPTGRFLAVWTSDQGIAGRLFEPDGRPVGGEALLAPGARLDPPDVIADPAGGFLLAWRTPTVQPADSTLHLQRFDLRLTAGTEALLDAPGFPGAPPRLAPLAPGGYVVTWGLANPTIDTPSSDLYARRLDPALQPVGGPLLVARETPGGGSGVPVAYADGGFAYVWSTGALLSDAHDALAARRFDADGEPAGETVIFHRGTGNAGPSLGALALPSGDTWVVWPERSLSDDADGGIYSGLFDPAWQLRGAVSRVNTGTVGAQVQPVVATAPGGTVAAWSTPSPPVLDPPPPPGTVGDPGIYAQRFSPLDCALASDQLCLAGHFRVTARFTDPRAGGSAAAQAIPLTGDTGAFWFFDAANLELTVKVLDGRLLNGHFWVFSGALSDVEYTLTVTDLVTSQSKTYYNAPHQLASRADTAAF
jgi:hypothetical protein